jgi:hypothetical protein
VSGEFGTRRTSVDEPARSDGDRRVRGVGRVIEIDVAGSEALRMTGWLYSRSISELVGTELEEYDGLTAITVGTAVAGLTVAAV